MPDSEKPRELPPMAVSALSQGNKIEAIKIVRQEWGLGLKEAKDAVEAYARTQPALAAAMAESSASSKRGCVTWLIGIALAAAAVAYYYLRGR